ncbi:MAG TPA: hypothetical protein VN038_25030 [Dyadobacter sp.]|nr:hypothetical protein [Dyadobacter sp.]
MKNVLAIITLSILIVQQCWGQISIEKRRSTLQSPEQGFYINDHFAAVYQSEVPDQQKIDALLREDALDMGSKTYRFATATKMNVDFVASAH